MKFDVSYMRNVFVILLTHRIPQPLEFALQNAIDKIDSGGLTETDVRDVEHALANNSLLND